MSSQRATGSWNRGRFNYSQEAMERSKAAGVELSSAMKIFKIEIAVVNGNASQNMDYKSFYVALDKPTNLALPQTWWLDTWLFWPPLWLFLGYPFAGMVTPGCWPHLPIQAEYSVCRDHMVEDPVEISESGGQEAK